MKFNIKDRKVLVSIAVISALSIGGIMINLTKHKTKEEFNMPIVETYSVASSEKVFINGAITPKNTKSYYKDLSLGEIEKINVNSGELVDEGHLLYTCKNTLKEEEVKENEAELKLKESELSALKKNPEENKIDIKVVEKEISNLKNKISKLKAEVITKVTAPFSGTVYIEESLEDSDIQLPFLILDSRDFYIEGTVNERDLFKIKTGMDADIHIFSSDEDRTGKVTYISKRPTASTPNEYTTSSLSQYKVRVEFDNQENLINGFHVQAKINITDEDVEIPVSAIFTEDGNQFVLVNDNGVARKTPIQAEIVENDTLATVISGLNKDDVIVKDVELSNLKDGDEIYPGDSFEGGEIIDSVQY